MTEKRDTPTDLQRLIEFARDCGYRLEVDPDGTERLIRPDGSVAVIARKEKPELGGD